MRPLRFKRAAERAGGEDVHNPGRDPTPEINATSGSEEERCVSSEAAKPGREAL
jgi:hypothetical protein